jgi:hypothetical protein
MVHIQHTPPAAGPQQPAAGQRPLIGDFDPLTAPIVLPFTVLWDHRERSAGWRFTNINGDAGDKYRPLIVPQKEIHMVTADYTIEGAPVFVERKSHDDLIGSIGGGHQNFRLEHERMQKIVADGGACFVVIESSYDRILAELEDPLSSRQLDPHSVEGVVSSWPRQFGVPWYFAGTRRRAEVLALRLLRTWYRKITGFKG